MLILVVRKETARLQKVNRGKPVSVHYVKDIECKASITGWLIFLGNCSQSSFFMVIFLFSFPKFTKGNILSVCDRASLIDVLNESQRMQQW
jgi:hypothetical protein